MNELLRRDIEPWKALQPDPDATSHSTVEDIEETEELEDESYDDEEIPSQDGEFGDENDEELM